MIALLLATVALADPCADLDGMPEGPSAVALRPADLGRGHRVCGRSEAALGATAYLLADTANFYGHIVATADLDGSWALDDATELFGAIELVRYDSVIGPLPAATIGPAWLSVGGARRLVTQESAALGLNAKLALPFHYANAFPMGLDVGLSGLASPLPWLRVYGQLSVIAEGNVGKGPFDGRVGAAPTLGAAARAGRAFAVGLDLLASFGLTAPVDHLAVAPSFRFSDGKRFGFELAGALPLAGRERAITKVDLRFSCKI